MHAYIFFFIKEEEPISINAKANMHSCTHVQSRTLVTLETAQPNKDAIYI